MEREEKIKILFESIEKELNISKKKLTGKDRYRTLVEARIIFSYIYLKYIEKNFARCGRELHRIHATIIHYNKIIDNIDLHCYRDLRKKLNNCTCYILSNYPEFFNINNDLK